MTTRAIEIWVGIFVVAGFVALFVLSMQVSNLSSYQGEKGFDITARFDDVSGLKVRSMVTMAGVRIGRVTAIEFDDQALQAVVTMKIDGQHRTLPRDSSANIYTAGLLGEKYIGLEAGGDEASLGPGDQIQLTQDALVLEKLLGQFISRMIDEPAK